MENKPSTASLAVKWGLVSAVLSSIWATIMYSTELWKNTAFGFVGFIFLIAVLYLAFKEYKSNNEGFMSLGQAVGLGTLLGAVSGVIGSIFNYVYMNFIDSSYIGKMLAFQEEKMIEQGLPDESIEMALGMTEKMTTGGLSFLFGVIFAIIAALILSLIIGAIMQKKKPVF